MDDDDDRAVVQSFARTSEQHSSSKMIETKTKKMELFLSIKSNSSFFNWNLSFIHSFMKKRFKYVSKLSAQQPFF